MNKVILMGRLTRDPEVRYSAGDNSIAVAKYTLAVDRRFRRNNNNDEPTADFFNCTAFGRLAEFAEKYYHKGVKILITGRIQNDNYTNKNGEKVYSVQVIVEEQEFAESKAAASAAGEDGGAGRQTGSYGSAPSMPAPNNAASADGFMNIPDGIDEELPFK